MLYQVLGWMGATVFVVCIRLFQIYLWTHMKDSKLKRLLLTPLNWRSLWQKRPRQQ